MKILFDQKKVPLRLALNMHHRTGEYESFADAVYDLIIFMNEKGDESIAENSLAYALKHPTTEAWRKNFIEWCETEGYAEIKAVKSKRIMQFKGSPFV